MSEIFFSTTDVAKMLYVDKSSVKRWADEKKLKCFRTPGGHRKFRADDVYLFMTEYHYGIPTTSLYPQLASDDAVLRRMISKQEYNVLASVCFNAAIKGKKDDLINLFSEVHKNGLPLPVMFDEILRLTLKRIDGLYKSEKLSPAEYNLAINALSHAVILLSDVIIRPSQSGKKAILASFENGVTDLMLKSLGILLESEGIDVLNLGAYATVESISQLVKTQKPDYVFVISHTVGNEEEFIKKHRTIKNETEMNNGKFVVCGSAFEKESLAQNVLSFASMFCKNFAELSIVQHQRVVIHAASPELEKIMITKGEN